MLALAASAVSALIAQTAQPTQDDNITTLHVYSDLVQIPTLVLDNSHQAIPTIPESRFFVSINGGPKFRVTHARPEGDDPISLAILLEPSNMEADLMQSMNDAIAGLAPLSLTSRDRVTLYAINCQLFRASVHDPTDPASMKQAVDSVLQLWNMRTGGRSKTNCPKRRYLWDSVTVVTNELREQPGRRVMLVISDGDDRGSRNTWNLARAYAQDSGVAIFGITRMPNPIFPRRDLHAEDAFNAVCQLSGGILLAATPDNLAQQLQWFIKMVRGRYIVEFPHPFTTKPATLVMDITIAKSNAFIRPAGASVAVDDEKIMNDPMTVHPDASYAPQVGNRKVLAPH